MKHLTYLFERKKDNPFQSTIIVDNIDDVNVSKNICFVHRGKFISRKIINGLINLTFTFPTTKDAEEFQSDIKRIVIPEKILPYKRKS